MSFLSSNSDSFHNLTSLSCNEDLLYLLSLRYTDGLSERSLYKGIDTDIRGLDAYSDVVEFQHDTYLKLRKDLLSSIEDHSRTLVKALYNSGNEYFFRTSACLSKISDHRQQQPVIMMQEFHPIPQHLFTQCQSTLVTPSMMSNPSRWPWAFEEFLSSLQKHPIGSLFYEPEYIRQDILQNIDRMRSDAEHQQILIDVQLALALREGSVSQLLKSLLIYQQNKIAPRNFLEELNNIPEPRGEGLHYMRSLCDAGGFHLSYFAHFVRLLYNSVTLAASEDYLYIMVSSANGVMLKVGTGEHGTQQGQVYLKKRIKRQEEVSWVYLQGKLYLRSHGREAGTIEVVCPDTFKTLETITLHCPEIFQHPTLQVINKNYPLLTDGVKLFIVGKRLNVQKSEEESQIIAQNEEEQKKKREEKLKKKQSQPKTESNDDHTIKLMEYVLYEFDLSKTSCNQADDEDDEIQPEVVTELYESFQGFFTRRECRHALSLHKNDIQCAVQWLTDEGEKERTKSSVTCQRKILLAQAEIISDISAKNLKNNAEVVCKDGSLLHPNQVSGNIWTMNQKHITVYTESGVKVFSKDPSSVRDIPEHSDKKVLLRGTYLKTLDAQSKAYYCSPGYTVSYEPTTKRFYILHFHWNQQTNVFPCLVTICNDLDQYKDIQQPGINSTDYASTLTNKILSLQRYRFEQPWKLNDWEFAFVFVIKEIEQRIMNSSNEEEKKKLRTEKTKYINKLNKVIEYAKTKKTTPMKSALRELRRLYMFGINGDLQELQLILQLLRVVSDEVHVNILSILNLWGLHSDQSIAYSQEGHALLSELNTYLYSKREDPAVLRLVINSHRLFLRTNKEQLQWLLAFQQNTDALQSFCQRYLDDTSSVNKYFYMKDSKIEYEPKVEKPLTAQSEVMNLYTKFNVHADQASFTESWTRLFVRDVKQFSTVENSKNHFFKGFFIDETQEDKPLSEEAVEEHANRSDEVWKCFEQMSKSKAPIVHRFMGRLLCDTWSELTRVDNAVLEWNLKTQLSKRVLHLLEDVFQTVKNNDELIEVALQWVAQWLKLMMPSSVTLQPEDCDIARGLVSLFQQMKDVFYKDNQLKDILNIQRVPGVDQTTERIFETSHPYERGKPQVFEETHFPDAIAIVVDFDPRCSSDPSHDFLSINSWFASQGPQPGVSSQLRDPIGISYRISGKPNVRRPIICLGNTIQAEFHPSGQARNEHSLNRWGFKVLVRPLYGLRKSSLKKQLKDCDKEQILKKFKSVDNILEWVNTMKLLGALLLENVSSLIGLEEQRTPAEIQNSHLLKWTLLKNGLVNFNLEDHLIRQPSSGVYTLVNKLGFDESSYLRTVNGQAFSKTTKEQTKYWQLKRELFRLTYRQTYNPTESLQQQKNELQSLWDEVLKCNPIVSEQIRQIREHKGDFYQFAVNLTKHFTDSFRYKQEKYRPTFKGAKLLWEQVEILLVLVVLYHSGLMIIQIPNIEEYLQGNLSTLSDARNDCVNYMINTVQTEKEWQQNVETLDQCWEELIEKKKTIDAQAPVKKVEEPIPVQATPPQNNTKLDGHFVKQGYTLKFVSKKKVQSTKKGARSSSATTNNSAVPQAANATPPPPPQPKNEEEQAQPKRYIDEQIRTSLFENFRQRLEGNSDMVKQLCKLRNISFNQDDPNESMRLLFNEVIELLLDKESDQYKSSMQSPYVRQANEMIKKALFLLLINNSKNQDTAPPLSSEGSADSGSINNSQKKLKPLGMLGRSQSHQLDERQVDRQKLQKFRLWLDSYQKWKQLHSVQVDDEMTSDSPNIPPVQSVVNFLKSDSAADMQLLDVMKCHDRRCVRRIVGLQILNEFSAISGNFAQTGILCTGDLINHKVELSSSASKQTLLNEIVRRLTHLITQFNSLTQQARKINLILGQHQTEAMDASLLEQMKLFQVTLGEINQLLVVNNHQLWSHPEYAQSFLLSSLFRQFVENLIQIGLLNCIFVDMTQHYQTLALMSHHILYAVKHTLFLVSDYGQLKHIQHLTDTLVKVLKTEIGLSSKQVRVRQLAKLHDAVGITRVNLLLTHIYDTLIVHQKAFEQEMITGDLCSLLLFVVYHSNIPSTVRLAVRSLKIIYNGRQQQLESPLTPDYIWESYNLDKSNDKLEKRPYKYETKVLEYEKPQSQYVDPMNPIMLLFQKLGGIIAVENRGPLETLIYNEVQQCQAKNKPQRNSKKSSTGYKVLVQVSDDEEISHLVRVLYFWEELYPTMRLPTTMEEYYEHRERERKREEQKNENKDSQSSDSKQAQQTRVLQQYKILERVLLTHPDVIEGDDLNLGCGFNMTNLYGDMKVVPTENRKGSSMRKSVKKNWNLPNAEELDRKYEELLKATVDMTDINTPKKVEQFLAQRNFIRRMYHHTQEVMFLSRQLQVYGYCALQDQYPLHKAQELAQLIRLSIEGKLQPIPLDQFDPEFAKKVDPNPYFMVGTLTVRESLPQKKRTDKKDIPMTGPKPTNNHSNMVTCIMDVNQFTAFEFRMDYITLLPQQGAPGQQQSQMSLSFYHEANRSETFGHCFLNGKMMTQVSNQLIGFLGHLVTVDSRIEVAVKDAFQKVLSRDNKQVTDDKCQKFDEHFMIGLSSIFSGWALQVSPGLPAYIKQFRHEDEKLYIVEGGVQSGQKQCVLISENDDKLNLQTVKIEEVQLHNQVQLDLSKILEQQHYKQLLLTIIQLDQYLSTVKAKYTEKNQYILLRNLLNICSKLSWDQLIDRYQEEEEKQLFTQILNVLMNWSSGCVHDQSGQEYEQEFSQSWERTIDFEQPQLLFYPVHQDIPSLTQFMIEAKTDQTQQGHIIPPITDQNDVLTPSCYLRSLPEPVAPQNEHKMLRYWENYIIPKIQDYVRGSLKPFEYDDFMEQIRQPLRKGDQAKALEIAYIICDHRLPSGVVVPDANHDWSTLNLEEIIHGQTVIARLTDKGNDQIYSQTLNHLRKQNVNYVAGQVIGVEMKSNSVLIMHFDSLRSTVVSTWFPASALKQVHIYAPPPAHSFSEQQIKDNFIQSLLLQNSLKSLQLLMQMTHGKSQLKSYEVIRFLNFNLFDIIEHIVMRELQGACIDAWLQQQGNHVSVSVGQTKSIQNQDMTVKEKTDMYLQEVQSRINQAQSKKSHNLRDIQHYMDQMDNDQVEQVLTWLDKSFQNVKTFIQSNMQSMELSKANIKGQPTPLNMTNLQISGICVVFKNESILCQCGALRFYSDPLGINNFKTVAAGKENRHNLPPLIFDKKQVYCEYFFNADALPPFLQANRQSVLKCQVYPIPPQWNTCCWMTDALATSLTRSKENRLPQLQRLNQMLQKLAIEIPGPHLLTQQIYKLIFRTTRKIRAFVMTNNIQGQHHELIGLSKQFIQDSIEKANQLHQQQTSELSGIYSAYIQDLVEMIAVALSPLTKQPLQEPQTPSWINAYVRLLILMDFIKGDRELTEDLLTELQSSLKIDSQWENIVIIKGLPEEIDRETLCQLIEKQKGRVLNPAIDVEIGQYCVILLDGWASLDLEEQSQDQKRLEEEKAAQKEEQVQDNEDKVWNCEMCTLENRWEATVCEICGAPAPANKEQEQEVVQKVDMSEQEKLMQLKDQDRFNALIASIKQAIEDHYQKKKEELDKQVKDLEAEIATIKEKQKQPAPKQNAPPPPEPVKEEKQNKLKVVNKPPVPKTKSSKPPKKSSMPTPTPPQQQPEQQQQQQAPVQQPEVQQPLDEEADKEKISQLESRIKELLESSIIQNNSQVFSGKSIFDEHQTVIQKFLSKRFTDGYAAENYSINSATVRTIKAIFKEYQKDASYKQAADDAAKKHLGSTITNEEEFIKLIETKSKENAQSVFRFLEALGIDLWLNQTALYRKYAVNEILKVNVLKQLKKFIEMDVCKETKAVLSYKPTNIRFPDYGNVFGVQDMPPINYGEYVTSLLQYRELMAQPQHLVRISWGLLKLMNQSLDEAGLFINMEIPNDQPTNQFSRNVLLLQTAAQVCVLRDFYMAPIKIDLVQKVLSKTAVPRDGAPKINVERLKMAIGSNEKRSNNEIVTTAKKDEFMFTKAYEQMKDIPSTSLRPIKPTGSDPFLAFELNFKGEDVQGESGPYRQFFADISKELEPQSSNDRSLYLLHPSVNNVARLGNHKDKFVIHPSAKSTYQLQLYEFLGILMGCSVRTATHFTLDLPSIFWKQLVGESINVEDIEEIDATLFNLIQFLEECNQDMFESSITENWVTLKSDRTVQELRRNGAKHQVQFHERVEYIEKLLQVKMTESDQQINAIKKGISTIIPTPLLNLITAQDIELWVCGRAKVDIDLLRRHTRYSGELNENAPRVKFLWEALAELTEQEKLRFVKFCWGQERLPANDEEFERNQIRFMIKPATYSTSQPDRALPKADTCFFNIELPKYSSKDILKSKLLTAINFDCDSMNAEQRVQLDPNAQYGRGGDSDVDIEQSGGEEEHEYE